MNGFPKTAGVDYYCFADFFIKFPVAFEKKLMVTSRSGKSFTIAPAACGKTNKNEQVFKGTLTRDILAFFIIFKIKSVFL